MKPTLLILAAGIGSRYGGLKQVDGIGPGGEAIIEYSIYDALRAGFGKVVFVIRRSIEAAFKEKFAHKLQGQIEVDYVFQELNSPIEGIDHWPYREKPWGTGHAILVAASAVTEPFVAINADDYYGPTAFQAIGDFLRSQCSPQHYAMVAYQLRNTLSENGFVSRGVCTVNENDWLTDVVEHTKIKPNPQGAIFFEDEQGQVYPLLANTLVSMNFWGMHPTVFEHLHRQFLAFFEANAHNPKAEFYIPFAINDLIQEGLVRVSALPTEEQWYGVTYQEDKAVVQSVFAHLTEKGIYPKGLWK